MRKITQEAVNALYGKYSFKKDNTQVLEIDKNWCMFLYGSMIAKISSLGLEVNHHDFLTATTKERLNGLPGVQIRQNNFVWYLNGTQMGEGWHVV